jgi:hypothetical protein
MAKDVGLFAGATRSVPDRTTLLATADRFLALLGHPRPEPVDAEEEAR